MPIDLNQPQVSAAIVGGSVAALISLAVAIINQFSVRSMHRQRIAADQALAERKISADIDLAERKFKLDSNLAERKFTFDRELAAWRRRFDLAEQVLAAAYEARDALSFARGQFIGVGEGQTRVPVGPESAKVKEVRDLAFIPIERLAAHSRAFAALQASRDAILAHFGPEALLPISEIFKMHRGITSASVILVDMAEADEDRQTTVSLQPIREQLFGDKAKEANAEVDAAIEQLESLLRPVLSTQAPA